MPAPLLFDLDGTITDSAPGILASVEHALEVVGVPSPGPETLRRLLGPPMHESFRDILGLDEESSTVAMRAYRERFVARGMFENSLFPGMAELLDDLDAAGHVLALATSKPRVFAEQILEHFAVRGHFAVVAGSELSGDGAAKDLVVRAALASLGERRVGVAGAVMVGDREHDVRGAGANGIGCIGVAWGYAAPGELEAAGAVAVVADVGELAAVIRRRASGEVGEQEVAAPVE